MSVLKPVILRLLVTILTACFAVEVSAATYEDMIMAIGREPERDQIEKYYYQTSMDNGWYLQNRYREELINLRLKECLKTGDAVTKVCTEDIPALTPLGPTSPAVVMFLMLFSGLAGYAYGTKN